MVAYLLALQDLPHHWPRIKQLYTTALEVSRSLKQVRPKDAELLFLLASGSFKMGEVEEALTYFLKVAEVDAKHERALFNAALCAEELKQTQKAKELYRKLVAVNPQHTKGRGNLAILLDREGELEEAHSEYQKAVGVEKGKRAAPLLNNMGICSLKLGRSAEAVRHYKAAMQRDPDYSLAHFNCGLAYAEMDKVGDATAQFETCLKKDGDMAFAILALADLAEMKGQPDRALELYQSLQKKFGAKDIEGLESKVKGLARQLSKALLDQAF